MTGYVRRYRVARVGSLAVVLVKLTGVDPREDPHDHPYDSLDLTLRGGYREVCIDRYRVERQVRRVHRRGYRVVHQIVDLSRSPTWILRLTRQRRRVT